MEPPMKSARTLLSACIAAIACVALNGCQEKPASAAPAAPAARAANNSTDLVPATESTATTQSSLAGKWAGNADIIVAWSHQRKLPIRLKVAPDNSVTGTIGDAQLVGATLRPNRDVVKRSLGWGRMWRVQGKLAGDLVVAEKIHRGSVIVIFDQLPDGTLAGTLNSDGLPAGGKDAMVFTAANMRLVCEPASSPASAAPGALQ
jgi:hypothetical protein